MKSAIFSFLALSILSGTTLPAHAQTSAHLWSHGFGNTGADAGYSVATDRSGNVFMTGYFQETVDFGSGPQASAGNSDIILAKYAPDGTCTWSQGIGGTSGDQGFSVATDASGNVLLTGAFSGMVVLGGDTLVSVGDDDILLAKYSPAGSYIWSRAFGSTGIDYGWSVATDTSGNVFITGYARTDIDMGGGLLVGAEFGFAFLAKYDANGTHLWSQSFGTTDSARGYSVATDTAGNVFLTGSFIGTADFGGGPLVSAGSGDVVLAKFAPDGTHLWSQRFGSTASDEGRSVATDSWGNVFLAGRFQETVDFGGGPLVSAGLFDIVLAKYDPSGTHLWSQRRGGTGDDRPYSVATDPSGSVSMTGTFAGSVDFGGSPLVSAGLGDVVLARYAPDGSHVWSQRFGNETNDFATSVASDAAGNVFMTGYFYGSVDFGGGVLQNAGNSDAVLARYTADPVEPVITSITDIGNDQGRKVKIRFNRSGYDQPASPTSIVTYDAYRRDDPTPSGARNLDALSGHESLADGWTYVGSAPANGENTYGLDLPTLGDSTVALGQYYSHYYVRAATSSPYTFFDSPADSGYSVDNLSPGVPGGFAYNAGVLSWQESPAEDFDYFTVYGSNTDSFGAATVVDYSVAPTMDVTSAGYVFYFVTATDFSGNEGKAAQINTLSGVGGTPASYVLSVSNFPNPFNPNTTVSYTVPSRGNVTVTIYDAHGARVATLVNNETREAGAYRMEWNGRMDNGIGVSSGIYFARIEQNGAVRSKKMVLLK